MRLRWPFRRRSPVVVLPAAMSLEQYRDMCIGREVNLLAEHILKQVQFVPVASINIQYIYPDGRPFEVSVAAKSGLPTFNEPVRKQ